VSRTREKALNEAIVAADPAEGFEPYASAYVEFYHADVVVRMQERELAGRQKVFSALVRLLTLLDMKFGKAGARSRRLRLLSESEGEDGKHVSLWELQVDRTSEGAKCIEWHSMREWRDGRVVREVIQESSRGLSRMMGIL
jgi:hypothetical protein